jgi:hypothetical protein
VESAEETRVAGSEFADYSTASQDDAMQSHAKPAFIVTDADMSRHRAAAANNHRLRPAAT